MTRVFRQQQQQQWWWRQRSRVSLLATLLAVCLVVASSPFPVNAAGLFPSIEDAASGKPVSVTSRCGASNHVNEFCDPTDDNVTATNSCNGQTPLMCDATCPFGSEAPTQYDMLDPDSTTYNNRVTFRADSIGVTENSSVLVRSSSAAFPPAAQATSGLTLAARIKSTQQGRICMLSKTVSGVPVYSLCLRGADRIVEFTAGTATALLNHEEHGLLVDGEWHHVAVVVLQDQARFYIDGVIAGTVSTAFPSDSDSGLIVIGQGFNAADAVVGDLGGVFVYSQAVETFDVCDLANTRPCQQAAPEDGCRCPSDHPVTAEDNPSQCVTMFSNPTSRTQRTNAFAYGPTAMVDSSSATFWRSATGESPVNVTIDLQGMFEFMRLSADFVSDRPHSLVVERSSDGGYTFSTYRYVSRDCSVFGLPTLEPNDAASPDQVICTQMGDGPGSVGFVLFQEGNLPEFLPADLADVLFPFSQVTHLRLHIPQLAGAYDGSGDPALRSAYVAIADVTVMARILCHGHADSTMVVERTRQPFEICDACAHNTQGDRCGECRPLYRHRPFARGTGFDSNACEMCRCNGHAIACAHNATLNAGICIGCSNNTVGDSCDSCQAGFYRPTNVTADSEEPCRPCSYCNSNGVDPAVVCVPDPTQGKAGQCACVSPYTGETCEQCIATFFFNTTSATCQACGCDVDGAQANHTCNAQGACTCKEGYTGAKCDACADGFYRSQSTGLCVPCNCNTAGTVGNTALCDKATGECPCAEAHTGRDCNACEDAYYLLGNLTCAACNCFSDGAVSASCDSDGACTCAEDGDLVGDKCDTCRPGLTANYIRQCEQPTGDVLLVVDVSVSVTEEMLQGTQQFLRDTVSALSVGETATRVGIVQYASGAAIEADLNDHFTVAALQDVLADLSLTDTSPLLGSALSVARSVLRSSAQGGRTGAADTVVLVTASTSDDSVDTAAGILEAEGVAVIVVGIGAGVSMSQLRTLASTPDDLYLVDNVTALTSSVDLNLELTPNTCDALRELWAGCRPCDCDSRGIVEDTVCDAVLGQCVCKERTTGLRCDRCADSYAGLTGDHPLACSGIPSVMNQTTLRLVGERAVNVSWLPPINPNGIVTGYIVRRNGQHAAMVSGSVFSYLSEGLQPGDTYTFTVAAETAAGQGPESPLALIRIPDTQPEGLSRPNVTELSPFEVQVTWSPPTSPNGVIVGYALHVNGDRVSVGLTTSHTLQVDAFTDYSIEVEACNSEECAVSAATRVTTSPADVQSQGAPVLVPSSPRNLTIMWQPPVALNGDLDAYTVQLQQLPDGNVSTVFTGTALATSVAPLVPFSTYRARVITSNKQTDGAAASPWANTTLPPDAPDGVLAPVLEVVAARSVEIRVAAPQQPNGITESYTLLLNTTVARVMSAPGTVTLDDLVPFTTYAVVLRVCTASAGCTLSSPLPITTEQDAPGGVAAPVLTATAPTTVEVAWTRPSSPNGIITQYDVQRTHHTDDAEETTTTTTVTAGLGEANFSVEVSVSPFQRYTFVIVAFTSGGSTASDGASITTPEASPTDLAAPTVSNIQARRVNVQWAPPSNPNGALVRYHVLLREAGASTDTIAYEGLDTNTTIQELSPFSSYRVRVRFVNSVGVVTSDFTDFDTQEAAPSGVSAPQIVSTTASSLSVQWVAPATPNGVITGYVVHADGQALELAPSVRQVTVTGLLPNQEYAVLVEACTQAGCTSSDAATVTTDKRAPATPSAPRVTPLDPTTILARWTEPSSPNQPLTLYELYRNGIVVFAGLNLTFTDEGLMPGTTYAYTVVAYNDAGGSTSSSKFGTTPEDTPSGIAPPILTASSSSAVAASWSAPNNPNGVITSFALINLDTDEEVCNGGAALGSCTVSGLAPYTTYSFQVQACTSSGCGLSSASTVRTQVAPPQDLSLPSLSVVNATSVSVSWMPPRQPNGPVAAYQLWVAGHFADEPSGVSMPLPSNGTDTTTTTATTTTTTPSTSSALVTTQGDPTALNLLDPANVNGTAEHNDDGSWTFASSAFLRLDTHGMRITSRFSVALDIQQVPDNSGYYFAKSDAIGRRYFSLYNTATSGQLYFVYRVPDSTDLLFTRFATRLNDGNRHKVLVSVDGQNITATVDGTAVGTNTLDDVVDDCGPASSDCIFFVGQKASVTDDTLNFEGTMYAAALFPDTALEVFPDLDVVLPGGGSPSTSGNTTPFGGTTEGITSTEAPATTTPAPPSPASALELPAYLVFEGDATSRVVAGLRPYTQAIAFVRAINSAGSVDSLLRAVDTPQAAPEGVAAPNATAVGPTTALVEWSPPDFSNGIITRYQIRVREADSDGRGTVVLSGLVFSHFVSDLEAATSYEVQVVVFTSAGGTGSAWTAFATREALPMGLATPAVSNIGARSAQVAWSEPSSPNGDITRYTLRVDGDLVFNGDALQVLVPSLTPDETYTARLEACNSLGCTSNTTSFSTLQAAPEGFAEPVFSTVEARAVELRWQPPTKPNGEVAYFVQRSRLTGPEAAPVPVDTVNITSTITETSLLDDPLTPYTRYRYRVAAFTTGGNTFTTWVAVRTSEAAPERLAPPEVTATGPTSLSISWSQPDDPNGAVLSMQAIIVDLATEEPVLETAATLQTSVNVTDPDIVSPFSAYEVYVLACNSVGCVQSSSTDVMTPEDDPAGLAPPQIEAVNASAFDVTWEAPSQPNGEITMYILIVGRVTGPPAIMSFPGNARSHVFADPAFVDPYTTYQFLLQACNSVSCVTSLSVEARSGELPPQGFSRPSLVALSNGDVSVSWSAPAQPNGRIIEYTVLRQLVTSNSSSGGGGGGGGGDGSRRRRADDTVATPPPLSTTAASTTNGEPTAAGGSQQVSSTSSSAAATTPLDAPTSPIATPTDDGGSGKPTPATTNATQDATPATATTAQDAPSTSTLSATGSVAPTQLAGQTTGNTVSSASEATSSTLAGPTTSTMTPTSSSTTTTTTTTTTTPALVGVQHTVEISGVTAGIVDLEMVVQSHQQALASLASNVQARLPGVSGQQRRREAAVLVEVTAVVEADDAEGAASVMQTHVDSGQLLVDLQMANPTGFRDAAVVLAVAPHPVPLSPEDGTTTTTASATPEAITTTSPSGAPENEPVLVYRGLDTQIIVSDLLFNTEYLFTVVVRNGAGDIAGDSVLVSTADGAPAGMPPPHVQAGSSTTLSVDILPPAMPNSDDVSYRVLVGSEAVASAPVPTTIALTDLTPFTEYTAAVEACSPVGCTTSEPVTARTLPAAPTGLAAPRATATSAATISVAWTEPERSNGILLDYKVWLRELQECSLDEYRQENGYNVQDEKDLPPSEEAELTCRFLTCPLGMSACGLTCYDPFNEACCTGQVHARQDGRECCGSNYVETDASGGSTCCGGQLVSTREGFGCCAGEYVAMSDNQVCCQGQVQDGNECCGEIGFVNTPQQPRICCGGQVFDNFSNRQCCGGSIVSSQLTCCGTTEQGTSFEPMEEYACCGVSYVHEPTSTCCGNGTEAQAYTHLSTDAKAEDTRTCCASSLIAADEACCNGRAYDPATETCADRTSAGTAKVQGCAAGTVCSGATSAQAVCGSCSFDGSSHSCFAVNVEDTLDSVVATTQRTLLVPPQQDSQCVYVPCGLDESVCGASCFGPDQVCCDGKIYQRDDTRRCCGTSYVPRSSGDVCCGNALYPSQAGHACCGNRYVNVPGGSVCCNGLVVTGDACCGSAGYSSSDDSVACCDSQLLETTPDRDTCCGGALVASDQVCCDGSTFTAQQGYECCGSEYVRTDSSLCCEGQDGAVMLHLYASATAKLLADETCCDETTIPSHLACCNGMAYDPTQYVCADRSTGTRTACAAGRLCPTSSAATAYCDSCSFDADAGVCGVAVGVPFTPECRAAPTLEYFGPDLNTTLTALTQDTGYETQVEAATAGGATRSEWTGVRTLVGTLPAPRLLVLGNTSVLVSWNEPPAEFGSVTRYEVYRGDAPIFSGASLVFEDKALTPGTLYTYEYVAVSELTTTRSRPANATTFTSVPAGFGRPQCMALSASSIQVSWEAPTQPNGDITEYILQRGESPDTRTRVQLVTSEVVQGLEPATEYTFRVFACTQTGCRGSPACVVHTDEAPPTGMAAPQTILTDGTQLTVSWQAPLRPNGAITRYLVQTRRVRDSSGAAYTTAASVADTTLRETTVVVSHNVEYAIRVVALNSAGNASSPAVLEPKAPESVDAPVVVPPVLAREATLAWTAVEAFVSHYAVLLKEAGEPDSAYTTVYEDTDTRATVTTLSAGRTYAAVVVAGNAAGNITSSATTFTTAAQVLRPAGFDVLKVTPTSATSAVITWSAPLTPNGEILTYRVMRSGPFAANTTYDADTTDPASVGQLIHDGLERFISDTELQPYSVYFYTVFAVNAGGATRGVDAENGDRDHAALMTLATVAQGLEAADVQSMDEALRATWMAPTRLNGELQEYTLEVRRVQEPVLEPMVLYSGQDTQFTLTDLDVFATYELRVNVRNSVGTAVGPWATATTCGGAPVGVPQPSVESRSATTIQLTWTHPDQLNGNLVSYNVTQDDQPLSSLQTRSLLVEDLTPYTEYTFVVETCVLDPCDDEQLCTSGPALTTRSGEGLPTGIAAPVLKVLGPSSINITWTPPTSPNGVIQTYEVLRGEAVVYMGPLLSFTDDALQSNVGYTYRVRASNGFGSVTSVQRSVTTAAGIPEGVSAPDVTVQSDTSALVCWMPPQIPNGIVTAYILVVNGEDRPQGLADCATLMGLTANTEYSVQLKACTEQGCGVSAVTNFVTRCSTPQSNSPDTIVPRTNEITLSWTPPSQPSCAMLRYLLFYGRDESDPSTIQVIDVGTNTSVTLRGLLPYTRYSFRLQVSNQRGAVRGPWVSTRTLEGIPQAVPAPSFIVRSATQLFVVWNVTSVPGGPITKHVLYRNGQRVGSFQSALYEANDLTPFQEYTFQVETCTATGCARSEVAMIRMPEAPPDGQQQPTVDNVAARSFRVSWAPPLKPYGIITSYEVFMRECERASSCMSQSQRVATVSGSENEVTVNDLSPFTVYQVQVRAINSRGVATSPFTTLASISGSSLLLRTLEAAPEVAHNLTCTASNTSITCNWNGAFVPNGVLNRFEFTVRDRDGADAVVTFHALDASDFEFTTVEPRGTYLVEVTAVNSNGSASVSTTIDTAPPTTPAPTTTTSTTTTSNTFDSVASQSSSDLTAGGIIGVAVAAGVLLLLVMVFFVYRGSHSRVHEMTGVTSKPAHKFFWEQEEAQVEVKPRERARPLVSPKQRGAQFLFENPQLGDMPRPVSRTWRDEYSESEADSYSLAANMTQHGAGGFPIPRRTSSLHGLLHNQHVQVLGQRQLDSARGTNGGAGGGESDAASEASSIPGVAQSQGMWAVPQQVPTSQHNAPAQPAPPRHFSQPQPQQKNQDELADLRSMLLDQQRSMQEYAARSLQAAQADMGGPAPTSTPSRSAQQPQYQQQQAAENSFAGTDAAAPGNASLHPESGYLQIAPLPSSHVDEPDTVEMRSVEPDTVSQADSEAPLVFTEAHSGLEHATHEEDTWL